MNLDDYAMDALAMYSTTSKTLNPNLNFIHENDLFGI